MRHDPSLLSAPVTGALSRLGERIRRARKSRAISLSDLEAICRVHRTTLGRLERGEPGVSLGVFLAVLEALGELADVELLLARPDTPRHRRETPPPVLERDF